MLDLLAQDVASYYGMVGDSDEALRWIETAFELSPSGVDARLLGSELFAPVRDEPGFAAAVEAIREAARARVRSTVGELAPPL
jgi:hypothetical protein